MTLGGRPAARYMCNMTLSLRTRLVASFVMVIVVTGAVSAVVAAWLIGQRVSTQAQDKARQDLNSARLVFGKIQTELRQTLRWLSRSPELAEPIQRAASPQGAQPGELRSALESCRRREGLDVLNLYDASGRLLMRARAPSLETAGADPVVSRALAGEEVVVAAMVASAEELEREGGDLAARARIRLVSTGGTLADGKTEERSGLLVKGAARVEHGGRLWGVLVGARLLNRDERVVDEIRETIYRGETFHGRPVGEGSICLGDVRIATNAHFADGQRAIGSRVDQAVRQRVILEGRPRIAPALVLNERHITAYEPIRDLDDKVVGILSLGIPESKFTEVGRKDLGIFLGITLGGVVLAAGLAVMISRRLTRPITSLADAVADLGRGKLERRVEPDRSQREIGALAEGFNGMASALQERQRELRHRTEEQIGKAERLAMIGRLAAGVAHEINNPLGGIMLFSNLMLRKAPKQGTERENLERISNEAKRCQRIVQGLLDFARRRDPKVEVLDVREVIEKTLQLVENQAMFLNIELVRRYQDGCPSVRIDAGQIQQVLINLVVNAVEAMKGKGRLTISVGSEEAGGSVRLSVADTGCGISEENLERLFEPFFTTKEVGHGTGLGLSISRGIVENHGGSIWAESKVGEGTTFNIRLPVAGPAGGEPAIAEAPDEPSVAGSPS